MERDRGRRAVGRVAGDLVVPIGLQHAAIGRMRTPVTLPKTTELPIRTVLVGPSERSPTEMLADKLAAVEHHIGGFPDPAVVKAHDVANWCSRPIRCRLTVEVDGTGAAGAVDLDALETLFST